MPKVGEKFICGGREFWCIRVDGDNGSASMVSGAAVIHAPLSTFEENFKQVGALESGYSYTAKNSGKGVVAGKEYMVTGVSADRVLLDKTMPLSLMAFAALF